MRYYIVSDIHGYFSEFHYALAQAGYFTDTEPHKLILLGDLFDRGREAKKMEAFVMDLLDKDEIILIRGNHEDLFEELVIDDHGMPYKHHMSNGTFDTAMQLTHFDLETAVFEPDAFVEAAKQTPFFRRILLEMRLYYETAQHIFVHGWIPCIREKSEYSYRADWRNATDMEWRKARWHNGIDAAVRADCCAVFITGVVINDPFFNFRGVKDLAAVETSTYVIALECFHMVITKLVCFNIIYHKSSAEVTAPKSNVYSCCGARRMSLVLPPSSLADRCHALSSLHPPPAALASLPNSTTPAYLN